VPPRRRDQRFEQCPEPVVDQSPRRGRDRRRHDPRRSITLAPTSESDTPRGSETRSKAYLIGHGYAPHVILRDRRGRTVYDDTPPCDPSGSAALDSTCVVKVPDPGLPPAGRLKVPQQLAFYGPLTPSPPPDGSPFSTGPQLRNPVLRLQVLVGDLHLDAGAPQNVYALDRSALRVLPVDGPSGPRNRVGQLLHPDNPGQRTLTGLPAGMTLTVDGVRNWATFAVKNDPGKGLVLWAAIIMLAGLVGSLNVRRRRIWVRAAAIASPPGPAPSGASSAGETEPHSQTLIEVGALTRTGQMTAEFDSLVQELHRRLPQDSTADYPEGPSASRVPLRLPHA